MTGNAHGGAFHTGGVQQWNEVVGTGNHRAEGSVHVVRAPDEDGEPRGLRVADVAKGRRDRDDRWIVAFDVSDLEDALPFLGERDQLAALVDFGGDRLLHEHIATGFDQLARDVEMRRGWRRHANAFDFAPQR